MKCFYHNADLDGHCSGELIRRVHPDCELIGINYGDPFPWDDIRPSERVYMVDFSLQPWADMERLSQLSDLIWIDHHKSALDEHEARPAQCRGLQRTGIGACALVWEHLVAEDLQLGPAPTAVRLLAEYDVWDHSDPDTLPFQYGMRLHEHLPGAPIWGEVLGPGRAAVDRVLRSGRTILTYQTQQNAIRAKVLCFETELDGLRCIAANHGLGNSQLFDTVWDPEQYDAMLTFNWRAGRWTVSLYSDKDDVDVSKVAKARGGGGHKGAAGFQCDDLPFDLADKKEQ